MVLKRVRSVVVDSRSSVVDEVSCAVIVALVAFVTSVVVLFVNESSDDEVVASSLETSVVGVTMVVGSVASVVESVEPV